MQFWRLVTHPRVVEISDVFDEEGFLYIVFDYPAGGDLAALVMDATRTFTEGFTRKVASAALDALIFLHSNGIIHGGVLPANIIFSSPTDVPGWADSSKLTFFRIDGSRISSIFTDIQDLAYCIVCIMRKKAGLLSRTYFDPEILQGNDWSHLTNDFVDFVDQLWNCEENYKTAETFLSHPWLVGGKSYYDGTIADGIPPPFLTVSGYGSRNVVQGTQSNEDLNCYLYIKMREKSSIGTRKWRRRWGVVEGSVLLLYKDSNEDKSNNQDLAQAIHLKDKAAVVLAMAKHDYTFGLQDTVLQQIVLWMRFDNETDYSRWKQFLLSSQKELSAAKTYNDMENPDNALSPPEQSFASTLLQSLPSAPDAESLVRAVDLASKEFTRQIEAQAASYVRKSQMLQTLKGNKLDNANTSRAYNHSLSPFPSEQKTRVHPAIKWDMRAQELMLVMSTGTPVNIPVSDGQEWFIVDATWFKHWIFFVSSKRRVVPPGPIDNLWMINPLTDRPYEHMREDTDDSSGDFRRVPPQIWELFEVWYGGGPAISVVGPPVEDSRRWTVHIREKISDNDDGESLVDLVANLEHPEDVIHKGAKNVAVKLQGRKPSVAELTFLSKTGNFYDGEGDRAERALSAVDSDEEAEEDDEDDSFNGSVRMSNNDDSTTSYAPLTAAQLQLIGDEEKSFSDVSTSLDPDQQNKDGDISNNAPAQAQKKRLSIFNRG
eukprot:CAMPEP_0185020012 /NCGR_PEP_ID=MMETSP1103-20130426/2600_1 /TAXON_ID=36769 /ORGANISM="Paraphysomonas bandaiensis, Strain Caron Lab Isolate" /LENGTH=713 /DNA_ID=CAMNT_0027550641 /DNA_START=303 /DNA_END=2444 /DNA_ORIENTATION=+